MDFATTEMKVNDESELDPIKGEKLVNIHVLNSINFCNVNHNCSRFPFGIGQIWTVQYLLYAQRIHRIQNPISPAF